MPELPEHDPADVEDMARRWAYSAGYADPDMLTAHGQNPIWTAFTDHAIRALDYMAARGEKMTTRDQCPQAGSVPPDLRAMMQWKGLHDAAPRTPRKGDGNTRRLGKSTQDT